LGLDQLIGANVADLSRTLPAGVWISDTCSGGLRGPSKRFTGVRATPTPDACLEALYAGLKARFPHRTARQTALVHRLPPLRPAGIALAARGAARGLNCAVGGGGALPTEGGASPAEVEKSVPGTRRWVILG
jgi:hypothetical protein